MSLNFIMAELYGLKTAMSMADKERKTKIAAFFIINY